MSSLNRIVVRSGVARMIGQVANLAIRIGYLAVLARLVSTDDFGLIAMVTVITGFLDRFTSAGLSAATIQKLTISDYEVTQLFWVNVFVGALLAMICAGAAPLIALFYHDPRLTAIMSVLSLGFVLAGLGVQHSALLERDLRYTELSAIESASQLVSAFVGVVLALQGWGYWALVAASVTSPATYTLGCWIMSGWMPKKPSFGLEIRPMLSFGGTIMLNNMIVYIGYNMEKVILGRYWGAETLGIYTRAVQLIGIPVNTINSMVGGVFFSALSKLQDNPEEFRKFFLKGYTVTVALSIPSTLFCGLFADEIVRLVLGHNWLLAVPIFQYMTPTILVFGLINPLAWLLMSTGRQIRSLYTGIAVACLAVTAYSFGLRYGANGVALSYSVVMLLWLLPHIAWCVHGTPISLRALVKTIVGPLTASIVAATFTYLVVRFFADDLHVVLRLLLGASAMAFAYGLILLCLLEDRFLYRNLLSSLRRAPALGA